MEIVGQMKWTFSVGHVTPINEEVVAEHRLSVILLGQLTTSLDDPHHGQSLTVRVYYYNRPLIDRLAKLNVRRVGYPVVKRPDHDT